jgi:parallel beta-helix repeat protein/YD repeat-containing protein
MKGKEMEKGRSKSNSRRAGAIVLVTLAFALFATAQPAIAGTVTYDYDDAGRLVEADYGNGTIGYEYDGAGNLLEKANLLDVETATGTGSASFGTEAGAGVTIADLEAVAESTLPEEGKPNIEFTHGFFSFNITGLTPGQTVNVTITLPADVPVGDLWWKVNTTAGNNTWYSLPIGDDDGDNTITLTDGGVGDNDGAANGIVRDPGGPGGFPVHNLDTGLDYMTIQDAIDDANTTGGHTITVDPGTYSENVRATKSLTLRSTSGDCSDTVVTAADAGEHVFNLTTNGVNVSGFTIENATGAGNAGIFFGSGVMSCNVTNNNVKLNYCGISLAGASDNNISCNWVHDNDEAGFYLTGGSTGNTIEQNNIVANGEYNDTSGGREWQFVNDQSDDVNTAGNWWGTNNETIINASIHDWTYNAGWGNVTTNPRLEGAVPCAPIPEMATMILLAAGILGVAGYFWIGQRRRRQ